MKLILRLVDANAPAQSRSLDSGTLSIGRGTENDWVLADPDRTLSKNHCRIDASDGGFMLTDLSTNGVFLAGSQQAVGRGHRWYWRTATASPWALTGCWPRSRTAVSAARTWTPRSGLQATAHRSFRRSRNLGSPVCPAGISALDAAPRRTGGTRLRTPRPMQPPDCSNRRAATGRSLTMPWARRLDCSANSPSIFPPPRRTCACPRPQVGAADRLDGQ